MKRFLSQISFFTLLLLSYFCLNLGVNFFIYKNQKINIGQRLLVAGDSHSKRAVNPKILGNAVNVSQQGEPYFITFWKLKKIFKDNKEAIDTLILSFAPHNIGAFNDSKLSDERWSGEMFKRIYPIQNLSELKGIDIDYLMYYKTLWKETGFYPKLNHINYRGSYLNSNVTRLSEPEASAERQYFSDGKLLGVSRASINYLDSIIKLCNSNKIKSVLVSSPVHPSYYDCIPRDILETYSALNNAYQKLGVQIVDLTHVAYPDSLYFDAHHLNERGAKKFTKELKESLAQKNNFTKI